MDNIAERHTYYMNKTFTDKASLTQLSSFEEFLDFEDVTFNVL